jgi:hypothetical protein
MPARQLRRFPTSTKTRRAALFRRALVSSRKRCGRARRLGALFAFARRPPPLAATWRARFGSRLGSAHRVPRLRAGRRLGRTRATCENRITYRRASREATIARIKFQDAR